MKIDSPSLLEPAILTTEREELAVIGAIINFAPTLDEIEDLKPEHFSRDYTRAIYAEVMRQIADGHGCSVLSVHDALGDEVATIVELNAIAVGQEFYGRPIARLVKTIIDKSRARGLRAAADKIAGLAMDEGSIDDRIDRAQAELSALIQADTEAQWVDAYSAALEHSALLERRAEGEFGGIATGLHDVDEMLDGGMQPGNLIIVGARPSHGKTALGLTIGLHTSIQEPTAVLSMEMSVAELMDRQAANLGRIPMSFIKRPKKGLDFSRVLDAVEEAKRRKLYLYDRGGLNILQVRRQARNLKRKHGLRVLVVDYIGLMSGLDTKQPRAYQIEEISRGLKSLAKELEIVVICLAQLNRGGADRANKRPQLTDLRDSGAIEQDADVVMFIHRQEMDNPNCGEQFKNYGLLFIAKNRQGRCGDVHLHYAGEETRFSSWGGPAPEEKSTNQSAAKGFTNGR